MKYKKGDLVEPCRRSNNRLGIITETCSTGDRLPYKVYWFHRNKNFWATEKELKKVSK